MLAVAGATALLVLLAALYQWRVGNIGNKSDSELCSEYCWGRGFASSGMPPANSSETTCSCFDEQGSEAVKVPILGVVAARGK